ncbi:MAG: tetratricopeptide repeat protein [Acidobacteria bacterium]|nr:tetratricopeptide repeat protein [Acidobacteriota bacterium]
MSVIGNVLLLLPFIARLSSATLTDKDTILMGQFANHTGDTVFRGTLEQPLRTALEESPFLSIVADNRISAALKEMGERADAPLTPAVIRRVCQRTHSKAYINGSIARERGELQIVLRATACESGQPLSEVKAATQSKDKVIDVLGASVAKLRIQLGEPLDSVRAFSTPLSRATSSSYDALKAWAAALKIQQESADLAEGSQAALPLLEQAVKLDSNFASALFTIGLIYRDALEETRARDYLIRAFRLTDRASVRERFRNAGMYYSFVVVDDKKAVETYQKWIELYPRDERPVSNLGSFYGDVCRYEEAIAQFRQARRMNPHNVIYHEDLIEILTAVGSFEEARQAYQEMLRMKLDDDAPHVFLYSIAVLEQDIQQMATQAAWFKGKPQLEHEILSEQADAEGYTGHLTRARELTRRAVEAGLRADNKEQAAAWQLNSAWREELFGNLEAAREEIAYALEIAPDSREEGAVAAVLLARAGDISKAEAIAKDLERRYPVHAVVQSYWLPSIRAQISLAGKHPETALRQLETARPYDLLFPQVAFYSPMFSVVIRAEAYAALGQLPAARKEWNKIAQNPGIVQLSATAPISKLQLARSLALQQGKGASSSPEVRNAYQDFLRLWREADPEIEMFKEAQAEFAALK